ncbi:DUF5320 domain-containing protein [Leptotrichia sp. OH3620_COT-345]|uniref:DUF5320 domain-containing protein n=1 Tax=Leptotrichia sp. OH3620_COT-345 TaxID=2491048 RepID=UPI0011CF6E8B|nr:DUF5320 domain-containing protein [Leptotrichia sp. OH3620_COT-345]
MSIKEYMKERNVSRRTIYNRIEKGQLEVIKEKNKTYIVKENLKAGIKKSEINISRLRELNEILDSSRNSNEILKSFDYPFLRERLSSIEKALINFTMDISKSDIELKETIKKFTEEIFEKFENSKNKNDNFMENLLVINEQNSNFFKENIENLKNKVEILENTLKNIENKLDELIKKQETKKGLFR